MYLIISAHKFIIWIQHVQEWNDCILQALLCMVCFWLSLKPLIQMSIKIESEYIVQWSTKKNPYVFLGATWCSG